MALQRDSSTLLRRAGRYAIEALVGIGLLAFQAGCGEPKPATLSSPNMADGLVLSWVIGRDGDEGQFVPTSACRFEMTPEGRFANRGIVVQQ